MTVTLASRLSAFAMALAAVFMTWQTTLAVPPLAAHTTAAVARA